MTFVTTVHQIYSTDKKTSFPPGTVTDSFSEAEVADLMRLGAVRVSSDAETALYRLANPSQAAAQVPESVAPEREALEVRATALGVKFNKNLSDAKLAERVAEAEAHVEPAAVSDLDLTAAV